MRKKAITLVILFLMTTFWCYGYIDPGTGSYVVQVLIAAFVGLSVGVKVFWKNIKDFFTKSGSKDNAADETEPTE